MEDEDSVFRTPGTRQLAMGPEKRPSLTIAMPRHIRVRSEYPDMLLQLAQLPLHNKIASFTKRATQGGD